MEQSHCPECGKLQWNAEITGMGVRLRCGCGATWHMAYKKGEAYIASALLVRIIEDGTRIYPSAP